MWNSPERMRCCKGEGEVSYDREARCDRHLHYRYTDMYMQPARMHASAHTHHATASTVGTGDPPRPRVCPRTMAPLANQGKVHFNVLGTATGSLQQGKVHTNLRVGGASLEHRPHYITSSCMRAYTPYKDTTRHSHSQMVPMCVRARVCVCVCICVCVCVCMQMFGTHKLIMRFIIPHPYLLRGNCVSKRITTVCRPKIKP